MLTLVSPKHKEEVVSMASKKPKRSIVCAHPGELKNTKKMLVAIIGEGKNQTTNNPAAA